MAKTEELGAGIMEHVGSWGEGGDWGRPPAPLSCFIEIIRLGRQVCLGGRCLLVEAYDFDKREEIGGCGVRVVHMAFGVGRLHDGIHRRPILPFLIQFSYSSGSGFLGVACFSVPKPKPLRLIV